jgi:exodeoxyribonuclease VII large subunit
VSAVGHDVDFTLVDFASDARAATPSQAAEMVVPDRTSRRVLLARTRMHLARAMQHRVTDARVGLGELAQALGDPRLAIASHQQTLDDREARLAAALRSATARRRDDLSHVKQRLAYLHPQAVIARERAILLRLGDRLARGWTNGLERRASAIASASARLDALSPLKVLARGYAIATRADGRAVRAPNDVRRGDAISIRVARARIDAQVVAVDGTLRAPPERGQDQDDPEEPR